MDHLTPQNHRSSGFRTRLALHKVRWLRAYASLSDRCETLLQDRDAQKRAQRLAEMARSDRVPLQAPKKRKLSPEKQFIGLLAVFLLFCWLSAGKVYFGSTRAIGATLPHLGSSLPEKKAVGEDAINETALMPFTPRLTTPQTDFRYALEDEIYTGQTMIVPGRETRLEAREAGKIAHIYVHADDSFRKGDMLMVYHCEAPGNVCMLRAGYDGKVARLYVKDGRKIAKGEPLISVVANGYSTARFDVPSKWLRWINIGAEVTVTLPDSGKAYQARIERIDNLVNPDTDMVSVDAAMNPAEQGVLWGMKGEVTINARAIREAGVRGYLESASAR